MEKECYCDSFNKNGNSFSKFLNTFDIIASSKYKRNEKIGLKECTVILKCKKCDSYYLWNIYSQIYSENDSILAKKYIPKTDEKKLKQILKKIEGIAYEGDIEKILNALE